MNAVVLAALLMAALVLRSHEESARGQTVGNVGGLAALCASAPKTDGFGVVTVTGPLVYQNSQGSISMPCKLDFRAGASLTMQNVQLSTQSLVIMDSDSNGPTRVTVSRSALTGGPGSGLFVDLLDAQDSLVLDRTTVLSYPAEVTATVGSSPSGPSGGQIILNDVKIDSLAADSGGITFSAASDAGAAVFSNVVLRTASEAVTKYLSAGHCVTMNVVGAGCITP